MKVDINPMGKPRMTQRDRWSKRDCVQKYWDFKDTLKWEAKKQKFEPSDRLEMIFEVEMPKSWSKKKKAAMVNSPHKQKSDIDNMCKAVMDALLEEDSHIYRIEAEKYWAEKGCVIINNL